MPTRARPGSPVDVEVPERRHFLKVGVGAFGASMMVDGVAHAAGPEAVASATVSAAANTRTTDATQITSMTAVALARAIRGQHVSCVEVMEAYLDQIERLNPKVNALVSLQPRERLLAQARERDAQLGKARAEGRFLGWMHGFPQAPKDLANAAGIATTFGSPIFKSNVATTDSIIVERARRSGAVLIGKTNTAEFGLGSNTYNPVFGMTLNAYDQGKVAGGSSGGAAAALALNMLPVADGSDMMGSLRNPAAWNNVVGFRPSVGRVPAATTADAERERDPLPLLGVEGPMARNVSDLALLLSVQAGHDARTPQSLQQDAAVFAKPLGKNMRGVRVGWMGNHDGYLSMAPGILETCTEALRNFKSVGCKVEAVQPKYPMAQLWRAWLTLRGATLARGRLGKLYADPKTRALFKPEAIWEVEQGLKVTSADLAQASLHRAQWQEALDALFRDFDCLVLPSAQVFAFDVDVAWPTRIADTAMDTYHRWMEVTIGATLAGLPALNVPAGFGPVDRPIGLQIIGRPQADLDVLQIGFAYELVSPYADQRSPLLG